MHLYEQLIVVSIWASQFTNYSEVPMKLHPFDEVITNARKQMSSGYGIHLQFNCAKCGKKQTFEEQNYLSETGRCEECGHITSLKNDGCNFMLVIGD